MDGGALRDVLCVDIDTIDNIGTHPVDLVAEDMAAADNRAVHQDQGEPAVPNIFDNLTDSTRLGPALRDSLDEFDSVDVATGYIDLRGWSNLADVLDEKSITEAGRPTARVLVGMVAPADSQQLLDMLQDDVQPPEYGSDIHDLERAIARRDQLVTLLPGDQHENQALFDREALTTTVLDPDLGLLSARERAVVEAVSYTHLTLPTKRIV